MKGIFWTEDNFCFIFYCIQLYPLCKYIQNKNNKKIQHAIVETYIKKNSQEGLSRFHRGPFKLKIPKIFTTAFLLKTIIEFRFFWSTAEGYLLKRRTKLKKDASHLKMAWHNKRQKRLQYLLMTTTENFSSIVCEVKETVFFFYKTYFKPKIHKTITSN